MPRCSSRASVKSACALCFRSSETPWCHGGGGGGGGDDDPAPAGDAGSRAGDDDKDDSASSSDAGGSAGEDDSASSSGAGGVAGEDDSASSSGAGGVAGEDDSASSSDAGGDADDVAWARPGAAHRATRAMDRRRFAIGRTTWVGRSRIVVMTGSGSPGELARDAPSSVHPGSPGRQASSRPRVPPRMSSWEVRSWQVRVCKGALDAYALALAPVALAAAAVISMVMSFCVQEGRCPPS